MVTPCTVESRIISFVSRWPGCHLEELLLACPDLQWNELFGTVDRMSRKGELRLHLEGPGNYTLRLPDADLSTTPHEPDRDAV